jgi:CheY-like chemotaxis protein
MQMKKVLLVEDDEYKARAVIRAIERAGLTALRCQTVVEGINTMRERTDFVALITDWGLPMRIDSPIRPDGGARVVQDAIRLLPSNVPIYVYSGHDTPQEIPGVRRWLQAPGDSYELIAILKRLGVEHGTTPPPPDEIEP